MTALFILLASFIQIFNPTGEVRNDEQIVLTRVDLGKVVAGKIPVIYLKGTPVPSQTDDVNGDGIWDELAFECNIGPRETLRLKVKWVAPDEAPSYPARTNIRLGRLDSNGVLQDIDDDNHDNTVATKPIKPYPWQFDGPGWENDLIGMRMYFDGRNSRDIFGKKVSYMVLDSVGLVKGMPKYNYQVMHPWGYDNLAVSGSFGPGGIGAEVDGKLVRLGLEKKDTLDNVAQTKFTKLYEGPVRSAFRLDYEGWDLGDGRLVNLHTVITIWAGRHGYENRVWTGGLPPDVNIVTGIVNSKFDGDPVEKTSGGFYEMYTFGKQTVEKEYLLGIGLLVPEGEFSGSFATQPAKKGLRDLYVLRLKPNDMGEYHFYVYNGWEQGVVPFASASDFESMMDREARRMSNPVVVTCR